MVADRTLTPGTFRSERSSVVSWPGDTISTVGTVSLSVTSFETKRISIARASLVLISGCASESTTMVDESETRDERAMHNARRRSFLLTLCEKLRSLDGPNVAPPPIHKGERMD